MNEHAKTTYDDDETTGPLGGAEILAPIPSEVSPLVAAEIDRQIATAKKYPRRRDKDISDEIMARATLNESIASECNYAKPVGNGTVQGPSIRFAEIVRASYGNVRVAARFVRIDMDDPLRAAVIVEAAAMDLQGNSAESSQVRRSIMTSAKHGRRPVVYSADLISNTASAAMSIARRNAILAVVPKALWVDAYQRAIRVIKGDATTLAKRRAEIVEAFERVGVSSARLFAALKVKSIEDITLEHMPQLAGMINAIREGENPNDVVSRAGDADFETVENPLKDPPPTDGTAAAGEKARAASAETAAADKGKDEADEAQQDPKARAAEQDAAAKAAAADKPKPTATEPQPANDAEYEEYAKTWIGQASTATSITQRWLKEKGLRTACKVRAETLERLDEVKSARVADLGK